MALGVTALSNTVIGLDPQKTSRALVKVEPKRQLPQRDYQGKFVERNTGLMLNALSNIYSQLRQLVDLTKQSLNIEKKEQLDEKAEKRGERIAAGETDIPPKITETKEKGPGIVGKIGKGIGSLWAGMGTKTAFALVVGGLALLTKFSDQLVGPLTNLLEWIRDDMIPDIQQLWKDVKSWWFKKWTQVKGFFTTVKGIFTAIGNWMSTFDLDKSGTGILGLDPDEWQALVDDIVTKISDKIWSISGSILKTLLQAFTIYTVGSIALKGLMGIALKTGAPLLALGGATIAFGVAAIAAIVATGIWKLADNITTAWDDAVTDELGNKQDFSLKEFTTRLLVGKETGNKIQDVMQNAYDKMFIGAAAGATIGGVMGAGVFSIPAAGFGAVIGALSGITIGALTAYYGKEAVEEQVENMLGEESPLGKVVSYITDMYKMLILTPFEFIFGKLGEANDSLLARLGFQFDRASLSKEDLYGEFVVPKKVEKKSTAELLKRKEGLIKEQSALPETKTIFGKHLFGKHLDTHEKRKIYEELETINAELASRDEPIGGADISNSDFVLDKFMVNKLSALGMKFEPSPYGGTGNMIIAGNKSGSDNTNIKTDNVYAGGLGYSNTYPSAKILSKGLNITVALPYN